MLRTFVSGIVAVSSLAGLASCGLGDATENLDAVSCQSSLAVTGTFTLGAPASSYPDYPTEQPPSPTSCWPVGKWSMTVATAANPEGSPPECSGLSLQQGYEFNVDRVVLNGTVESKSYEGFDKVTYTGAGNFRGKISQGGSGSCSGSFELFSDDGKTVQVLSVSLDPATNQLTGAGTVKVYDYNQWKP